MLLRASGEMSGNSVDASVVTNPEAAAASGIANAPELIAFADAVVGSDEVAMATARQTLRDRLGAEALVDTAAVASNFQRMVRIADSTGIPLDGAMDMLSADLREQIGVNAYGSSANTPESGPLRRALGVLARPIAFPLMRLVTRRMKSGSAGPQRVDEDR